MSTKLNTKQRQAVVRLVAGEHAAAIARNLKLRKETLSRWQQKPEFREACEKLMQEMEGAMRHRLMHIVSQSLDALSTRLKNEYAGEARIKTALSVLRTIGYSSLTAPKAALNAPLRFQDVISPSLEENVPMETSQPEPKPLLDELESIVNRMGIS